MYRTSVHVTCTGYCFRFTVRKAAGWQVPMSRRGLLAKTLGYLFLLVGYAFFNFTYSIIYC
jgi:hypothetical protein